MGDRRGVDGLLCHQPVYAGYHCNKCFNVYRTKAQKYCRGIVATLGVVFPSLVIISILAGVITNFSHLDAVRNAFAGIQVCVCVLIFNAVMKLRKKSVVDKRTTIIFLLVLTGSVLLNISPVWFVVGSAFAGILLKNWEVEKQ